MRGIIVALHFAAQESLPLYLVGSGLPSIRALVGKSKTYAERMFDYSDFLFVPAGLGRGLIPPFREGYHIACLGLPG